jgi:hypothetical protein
MSEIIYLKKVWNLGSESFQKIIKNVGILNVDETLGISTKKDVETDSILNIALNQGYKKTTKEEFDKAYIEVVNEINELSKL